MIATGGGFSASAERGVMMNEDQNRQGQSEYTYRFTGTQSPWEPQPPKSTGGDGRFFKRFLTVLLCVALSFGAGVGGAYFAYRNLTRTQAGTGSDLNPAPSGDSLYHSDPESLLGREEIEYSPYGSAGESAYAISEVVRMVEDSVVVIQATVSTSSGTGTSAGSGVIIHEDGYILTCHHVVDGARSVTVQLSDGVSKYAAVLVGSDEASDLAVLKIQPKEDQPLTAAKHGKSGYLVKGEIVVAIGNPLGTLGGSVTNGIISATERQIQTENGTMTLIQTNAAINSGNSGGGLFNLKGELIGIVNAKYAASGVEGLAFAIPIDSAYEVECDLIEFGYVRGIIDHGITAVEINSENLSYYYFRYGISEAGLYVVSSKHNTDLKNKDRIVSVNGKSVNTEADLELALEGCAVGDTVAVEYVRNSKKYSTSITLLEYIPDNAAVDFS